MIFGIRLLSSFLMSTIYSFRKNLRYRQTSSGNVENLQLRLDSLCMTHFLTLLHHTVGFDPYFDNHWTRSTNQPLC